VREPGGRWLFESRTITWLFMQKDGKVSPLPLGKPAGKPL
jgi:hypothetical protein